MSSRRIKYLIKSKSFRFVKDLRDKSHRISSIQWNDKEIFYRTSSSDMTLIYEILLKSKYKAEYFFPEILNPSVIFDIGGNIGITALYMANLFPKAQIYSFEPVPENFKILEKNIKNFDNIQAFNFGLGSKEGAFEVYLNSDPENYGGISFYSDQIENTNTPYISCEVRNVNDIIKELEIDSVDLIKIDTEGAEYDILKGLDQKTLQKTSWIAGELHGNKDFELLNYLDSLDFSISLKKRMNERLFMFNAGKPDVISRLNKTDLLALNKA
jgi:FkbM family methyltransferase